MSFHLMSWSLKWNLLISNQNRSFDKYFRTKILFESNQFKLLKALFYMTLVVTFILTIRMQLKTLEVGCSWHVKCYIGQSTHPPLIHYFNVETNEIFAFHHPIWMDLKKAAWTELQRLTLQLLSFIPLLFLNVFRVSVLEVATCIMMPLGNRFCLYSPWCSFEVFQVKGTKEALTIWHCFYCLTKGKNVF